MPLKRNDVKKEAKIKYVVKIVRENDENQDGRYTNFNFYIL